MAVRRRLVQPAPQRVAHRSGQAGIDGSVDSDSNNFFIPEFGVNWKYRPDLALGVTVYGNGGMNTDYPGGQISAQSACGQFRGGQGAPYNLLCGSGNLGVDLMQLMIAPYVSWQFVKDHSVGIAPLIAYQRFKAEGLQVFDNPGVLDQPRATSPTTATATRGASACASATWASSPSSSRSAPPMRARSAWATSTSTRGCSPSRAASTSRRTSPSASAFRPTKQWLIALDFERIYYTTRRR